MEEQLNTIETLKRWERICTTEELTEDDIEFIDNFELELCIALRKDFSDKYTKRIGNILTIMTIGQE